MRWGGRLIGIGLLAVAPLGATYAVTVTCWARPVGAPFVAQPVDASHIAAVSGSDDKLGPGLGSSATAAYAAELSRAGLQDAVRAGHA